MEPIAETLCSSQEVKSLCVGWLEERVALFADDLLLFLNDLGPSLQGALHILNPFLEITGLQGNWTNSQHFPVDPEAKVCAQVNVPLQWVETFKYLGIIISKSAQEYMQLNSLPTLAMVKARPKAWENLPLSLLGHINLVKMKILPKFTYIFRNSPQWLPRKFFPL